MEFRHLRYFVAVAEERNFTRAAERLAMAQPPLSRQIQQLEDELGVALIDHGSRPLSLTESGRYFYAHAVHLLSKMDELKTMTKRLGQFEDSLTIGFSPSTLYGVLSDVFRQFRQLRPNVELSLIPLSSSEQLVELKGGRIDVGMGRLPLQDPAVQRITLGEEPLVVVLPKDHPKAQQHGPLHLKDIAKEPLILFPSRPRPSFIDYTLNELHARKISPVSVREVRELEVALRLVAAGFGNSFVPASVARHNFDDIVFKPIAPSFITLPTIMSTLNGAQRPIVDLLIQLVTDMCEDRGIDRPHALMRQQPETLRTAGEQRP